MAPYLKSSGRDVGQASGRTGIAPVTAYSASLKRIAILSGAGQNFCPDRYAIGLMIEEWSRLGIETIFLEDVRDRREAGLVFLHVDSSIVPAAYTAFANNYPYSVNKNAVDIRKRRYADGCLDRSSDYAGPVIVKTDLNYGGAPERDWDRRHSGAMKRFFRKAAQIMAGNRGGMNSKKDYFISDSLADVPRHYFSPDYIVQEFRPETDGEAFILREYIFLGDCHFENIERSGNAIFEEDEHVSLRPFSPHPRLLEVRRRLGLDYGKIDYSLVNGEPFIFDANKTLGRGACDGEDVRAMYAAMARSLAAGTMTSWR